jgi:CBS domain-containing protein
MARTVGDLMTKKPCAIDADKPVSYAAKMMRDEDVGAAPIVEGDRLMGMLTDRDIAIRVVAEGKDPESTLVRDVMSTRTITIEADTDLSEALRMMAEHQVRRLPVADDEGHLLGIVAQADVAREASDAETGRTVEQISQ